jgi:hypothetical protein
VHKRKRKQGQFACKLNSVFVFCCRMIWVHPQGAVPPPRSTAKKILIFHYISFYVYLGDGGAGFVFNLERGGSLTAGPTILFYQTQLLIFLNNFKVSIYPCSGGSCVLYHPTEGERQPPSSLSISMCTWILPIIWPGADWTLWHHQNSLPSLKCLLAWGSNWTPGHVMNNTK